MNAPRAVVLVEGESDRVALQTLAGRLGRDLVAEGVDVLPMGGITNTRTFAQHYGPIGFDLLLTGLYDAPEEHRLRQGLAAAGLVVPPDPEGPDRLGFFRCDRDLEDELIRALGVDGVEAVIEAAGEGSSLRLLAQMPAQRDWTRTAVLRRFLGSRSGRKARYAGLFVRTIPLEHMPVPLLAVLERTRA